MLIFKGLLKIIGVQNIDMKDEIRFNSTQTKLQTLKILNQLNTKNCMKIILFNAIFFFCSINLSYI